MNIEQYTGNGKPSIEFDPTRNHLSDLQHMKQKQCKSTTEDHFSEKLNRYTVPVMFQKQVYYMMQLFSHISEYIKRG